jgi:hypothetical protein
MQLRYRSKYCYVRQRKTLFEGGIKSFYQDSYPIVLSNLGMLVIGVRLIRCLAGQQYIPSNERAAEWPSNGRL